MAVEVFAGDTADPQTLGAAVKRLQDGFGLEHVVVVGDRGMITQARITQELRPRGLAWITALRAPQIRTLWKKGPLQLSLFDEQDLAEITSPDFPGERLIACRNPLLAEERARKREALLEATEKGLEKVRRATLRERGPLRGRDRIGMRVGKVLGRYKVGKHFRITITEESLEFGRDEERIRQEAALDGIYVIRTSVQAGDLSAPEAVEAYKRLSAVERGFRVCKGSDLKVRPIHHRREDRVRAHIFLCMLAHYVRWHMEQRLAPLLFTDEDPEAGQERRTSIVAPAQRSESADRKASRKRTEEGEAVHSFNTLLRDLATLTKNTVRVGEHITFERLTRPTPLQQRAFHLLDITPRP